MSLRVLSSTASAGAGGPRPLPQAAHSESVKEKKDLASWWKNFKRSDKKAQDQGTHDRRSKKQVLEPLSGGLAPHVRSEAARFAPDA